MLKNTIVQLAITLALWLFLSSAQAQPTSGVYQILSGRYTECCGFGGAIIYPLPNSSQTFVELAIDSENRAAMTILGQDMHTVFSIPPIGSRPGFTFSLSNGVVFPDRIVFGDPVIGPQPPGQPPLSYTVSNSAGALRINGMLTLSCLCADVPTQFKHTNVVAVLMPTAAIRVSEVEVCWDSLSNRTYQVQYRSTLTSNSWMNLGLPLAGTGSTNCVADKVPRGEPQRVYRVITLP